MNIVKKRVGKKIKDIDNTNNYARVSFLNPPMLNVVLDGEDEDGYRPEDFFIINYCPMCRKEVIKEYE